MWRSPSGTGPLVLAALIAAQPALAQGPAETGAVTPPAAASAIAPVAGATPQLVVASVKLNGGWRISKFVGSAVYDSQNHKIGSVDDLVVTGKDRIAFAILSVGGVPWHGKQAGGGEFRSTQLRSDRQGRKANDGRGDQGEPGGHAELHLRRGMKQTRHIPSDFTYLAAYGVVCRFIRIILASKLLACLPRPMPP